MLRIKRTAGMMAAAAIASLVLGAPAAHGAATSLRLDCGTTTSPLAVEFERLAPDDMYTKSRGFGWVGDKPSAENIDDLQTLKPFVLYSYMMENLNELNRDTVFSKNDLKFRADVPNGTYRITLTVGRICDTAFGSIDVTINGELAAGHVAPWTPGSKGPGNHRRIMVNPFGWWTYVRHTVKVAEGKIEVALSKNQKFYDEQIAYQADVEKKWADQVEKETGTEPYRRIGVTKPPYYFCGWPFERNSLMAIEILPDREAPVTAKDDHLTLDPSVKSPALKAAVEAFNARKFDDALRALDGAREPDAAVARAIVQLWLAGRLEVETDRELVPPALQVLKSHVAAHPEDNRVAELALEAEEFQKASDYHWTRGQLGKNHFFENDKAIGWWWLIPETSPLYYKAQLYLARAQHQLSPYFPTRGTEKMILLNLEKKFPDNRFVKYHLHKQWDPVGNGERFLDWPWVDYDTKVKAAPEWVRQLYPAMNRMVDLSEWWFRYRQEPEGTIGGGWGDDVEIVGLFGYMGYLSRDLSPKCIAGTAKLMQGLWWKSEIDPELGYCLPFTDAEHSAEWTGNTLGMMMQIDYGRPEWVERSMKTAKLLRDLWTDYDDNGHRHFRANYFGAAQVGSGGQANDSYINYRAIRPAQTIVWYNQNPTVAELYKELADGWLAAAMSTDRKKPKGVIPAEIAFPSGLIGGTKSKNWYTADHPEGTGNEDWTGQGYKPYVQEVLLTAYQVTGDAKYLEPLRIEYQLAEKYGNVPTAKTGARLQAVDYDEEDPEAAKSAGAGEPASKPAPAEGSEEWVGRNLKHVDKWLVAKRAMEGRKGALQNDLTREDIIRKARWSNDQSRLLWPLMTTEAGPTDRVAFGGCVNPFLIYTGGRIGGPLLEAAITYDNTTRDFAAAVLGSDPQGFRLIYHSLTSDTREIHVYPWALEPGCAYKLRYGPDADEDGVMDSVAEEREFNLPQLGTPVAVTVAPRITYIVEVDQVKRERKKDLAPDPGLSPDDIRFDAQYGLLLARIHNAGSQPVRGVEVAAYDGAPKAGGKLIGVQTIPNIAAPLDLEPKATTVGWNWHPTEKIHEIFVVVDPENKIADEITTFNNAASKTFELDPAKIVLEFRGGP